MKILSTKKVFEGFLSILNLEVQTSTGEVINREVMTRENGKNSSDGVCALVFDTVKKKYIFTKQFRTGLINEDNQDLIEVVAGTLETGEDPSECMKREIEEELGYKTDKIKFFNKGFVSPGGCTEKIYMFIVEVSEKISEGGGLESEHEEIEVIEMNEYDTITYDFMDLKTQFLVSTI
jgi:ADP-ribose pyrophosphatase